MLGADLDGLLDAPALAGTRWSVVIRDQGVPGAVYERNGDLLLETASIAKVFVLVELAARVAVSVTDPRSTLDRRTVAPVGDSGLWQHLLTDHLPVHDVARLVGSVSDNLATNVLIALIGLEAIQARAAQMAPGGSTLHDIVRDVRTPATPPTLSEGCASDWASILQDLHGQEGRRAAPGASVLDWLSAGADLSMVASAFGLDPLSHASGADRGLLLWNKTGTDTGVRADVGVVEREGRTMSYAVICNWDVDDHRLRPAVLGTMHEIGREIDSSMRRPR